MQPWDSDEADPGEGKMFELVAILVVYLLSIAGAIWALGW